MSLRLLEEITREMKCGWSMADLGTGSGILALAARRLGAKRVVAIDNDPWAISTAKGNARANGIEKVTFRVADARGWRPPGKMEVIVANLFSQLLVATLPTIRRYAAPWSRLILSGILRPQEAEVIHALKNNKFRVKEVRRRGKWIAILAASHGRSQR
jgi:ribosomal protein L11 methyltransferase